ncbi:MAG: diacylglycerol kinase [Rickettsiales bacterium]|jgi:diacylglycerol kinase (ATP)|nr:diacylglycerol kinase [Rickettsiales bacterium]
MTRILKAFRYSFKGLVAAFGSEPAFRQEVALFIVAAPIAFFLPVGMVARAALVSSLFLILMAELVNTAIEVIVDRISLERHPLSGRAKDIGSALVLVAFANAAVVWSLVLIELLPIKI